MLYSGSFNDIDCGKYDEIWLIVRSLKNMPYGNNIYHVPQLSPSPDLFHTYLSLKKAGKWDTKAFDEIYIPRFLNEMKSSEALTYLNILSEKSKKKDILIVCYCSDERTCHRSLVKQCISSLQKDLYVIVAGSRSFNDYRMLTEKLDYYFSVKISQGFKIHIVSGGAKGADMLAEQYAKEKGYESLVFPADWNRFGKSAGYKRNRQIHEFIAKFPYRACVCFWDGTSHGTADNFNLCNEYKTPLRKVIFTTER